MKRTTALIVLAAGVLAFSAGPARSQTYAKKDAKGRWVPIAPEVSDKLHNEVTEEYEDGFLDRVQVCIQKNTGKGGYGNTYFENEKGSYPPAMFDVIFGNRAKGAAFLQAEDNQAGSWNANTKGIDYYACFTIKHQMRKYFLLGDVLEPAYKQRMYEGAKLWTAKDPKRRPNPYTQAHKAKLRKAGKQIQFAWTPDFMDSWVDVRNTDNLRAMRETSVYLMAEETGNEAVRQAYKRMLLRYTWALWNIGMGEWDSENYHMHTFGPYVNLYDFAKDPEVKAIAKAALDMLSVMGAVKYYQGGFCGPIKRDYNKPYVFGGAAGELWLYFNDTPIPNPHPHGDTIHLLTSSYRPPMAVVELARKDVDEPYELFAVKPTYENWKVEDALPDAGGYPAKKWWTANHTPEFFETTYVGRSFQLGTLPRGSRGDVNGFKLLMRDSKKGAQFFVAASGTSTSGVNRGKGADRIAHYKNLTINLTAGGKSNWAFVIPDGATVSDAGGVRFIRGEKTWLALHPIGIEFEAPDGKAPKRWANTQGMTAKGLDKTKFNGFAMEVGEVGQYDDFEAFKQAVLSKAKLDLSGLADGKVSYSGSGGKTVGIEHTGGGLPKVFRDGKLRDFSAKSWAMWQPADGGKAPVSLGWKTGKLHVESGGWVFEGSFDETGRYTFKSTKK